MIKTHKLKNLPASQKVHHNNGKIYSYNDGVFYKTILNGNGIESLDFGKETDIYDIKSDVLAYVESDSLKVQQIKKETTLVDLPFTSNIISLALSKSAIHTIAGNNDGTVNIIHNISAESILKFTLFSNGDGVEFVEFLEENIIIGSTKKHIIVVDILEKGALAKISTKTQISDIITSRTDIAYRDNNDIYLVDISSLPDVTTTKIASLDEEIVDISFDIYGESIYALTDTKLYHIDFNSNINTIFDKLSNTSSLSIIDYNSLVVGSKEESTIISDMEIKTSRVDNLAIDITNNEIEYDPNLIRFLSVDDSATIRLVIKKAILNNFTNVIVDEANDGVEAMAYLKKYPSTDVVLLDWNMPNMDGGEVVEAMSQLDELSGVKIIMATTEGGKDRVKEMLSKGVKGYLVKPFRPSTVIPMIEKLIQLIKKERLENE